MALLFDSGIFSIEGLSGEILAGSKLYFYASGSSTPLATYSDPSLDPGLANANPVVAGADGRFGPIWLQALNYKIILKTFDDETLVTRDPIRGAVGGDDVQFTGSASGAVAVPVQEFLRDLCVSVKSYGATGDGSTNDTAAIALAIAACDTIGASALYFPPGTYLTTGSVIPADSGITRIYGHGATLKRQAQATTAGGSTNLYILVIYKNRQKIDGLHFDGINQDITVGSTSGVDPVAAVDYADLVINTYVGSGDSSATTDNMVELTGCYFKDAPGSCVSGSGMQSLMVHGCKFDGWFDHAVYASGEGPISADISVTGCIFKHTRYTRDNFTVKIRNNVRRFVAIGNTFDIEANGAFALDIGGGTTHYRPTEYLIANNVGTCGIFYSSNGVAPTTDRTGPVKITGNSIRTSLQVFYLGESSSFKWSGMLHVEGNTFINTGSWTSLFNTRFLDNTLPTEIIAKNNEVFGYAILDGVMPRKFIYEVNGNYETAGAFINSTAADDASVKLVSITRNRLIRSTSDGAGTIHININDDSTWIFEDNIAFNCGTLGSLRDLPKAIIFSRNKLFDSTGLLHASAPTARGTTGEIWLEENKCISTVGTSTVPRLFQENVASGPILESYNVFTHKNYFKDVTAGLNHIGSGVSGYGGSNKLYNVDNYGSGSTLKSDYQSGNEATALPAISFT